MGTRPASVKNVQEIKSQHTIPLWVLRGPTFTAERAQLRAMTESSDRNIGCNFPAWLIVPIKSRNVELGFPILGIVPRINRAASASSGGRAATSAWWAKLRSNRRRLLSKHFATFDALTPSDTPALLILRRHNRLPLAGARDALHN
jgi:hypothetical protein